MLPKATISHQTSNRIRLRIPAKKRNPEYFSRLREELRHCPGVLKVEPNVVTGSVLIHHRSEPQVVIEYAEERQLFSASPRGDPKLLPARLSDRLSRPFAKLDQSLGDLTRGEIGLSEVALLSLVGLGLFQMFLKKRVLPDGVTLLWYATSLHLLAQVTPKRNRSTATEKPAHPRPG
jgi:Heavy metal associated domain 2